jgi:hypothetical protein
MVSINVKKTSDSLLSDKREPRDNALMAEPSLAAKNRGSVAHARPCTPRHKYIRVHMPLLRKLRGRCRSGILPRFSMVAHVRCGFEVNGSAVLWARALDVGQFSASKVSVWIA